MPWTTISIAGQIVGRNCVCRAFIVGCVKWVAFKAPIFYSILLYIEMISAVKIKKKRLCLKYHWATHLTHVHSEWNVRCLFTDDNCFRASNFSRIHTFLFIYCMFITSVDGCRWQQKRVRRIGIEETYLLCKGRTCKWTEKSVFVVLLKEKIKKKKSNRVLYFV
jgi:hypothetical protein